MPTIYSGPGKIYFNSIALQPEGENGPIKIAVNEERAAIGAAMFGKIADQLVDQTAEITVKPFDHWGSLRTLFPASIGVKVGSSAAALLIGTRPHGNSDAATVVWTPDGRKYNAVRTAVVGHPSLHLGIGKALYGDVKISVLGASNVTMGSSGYLFTGNAINESGQSDPGGAMAMTDFIREAWKGTLGSVDGFANIEAEDEWTIECDVKYSPLKVQGRTVAMKLDSVAFMAKVRPYGPTQSQILTQIGTHTAGQRLGSADLTLTSQSSAKTITLKNAEAVGAGFEFGGTQLGSGEVGFVNQMSFTAGAPTALLEFSA